MPKGTDGVMSTGIAAAAGELEAHATDPQSLRLVGYAVDAPHIALAVEHVEVTLRPQAGRARGAALIAGDFNTAPGKTETYCGSTAAIADGPIVCSEAAALRQVRRDWRRRAAELERATAPVEPDRDAVALSSQGRCHQLRSRAARGRIRILYIFVRLPVSG
jgi:hypothetical protein